MLLSKLKQASIETLILPSTEHHVSAIQVDPDLFVRQYCLMNIRLNGIDEKRVRKPEVIGEVTSECK